MRRVKLMGIEGLSAALGAAFALVLTQWHDIFLDHPEVQYRPTSFSNKVIKGLLLITREMK